MFIYCDRVIITLFALQARLFASKFRFPTLYGSLRQNNEFERIGGGASPRQVPRNRLATKIDIKLLLVFD